MRVAMIGAGGLGGLYGGLLARGGLDVTFIARGRNLAALTPFAAGASKAATPPPSR